jgi:hypothetical protein
MTIICHAISYCHYDILNKGTKNFLPYLKFQNNC